MGPVFQDRSDAGKVLARHLGRYTGDPSVLVLGLPRGGVAVAYEVARHLQAPLDVFFVRKLGVPGNEELAMGAIGSGEVRVLNQDVVERLGISEDMIETATRQQSGRLREKEKFLRGKQEAVRIEGRKVILVDDGLATGASMKAAVAAVRMRRPARLIVAAPVGAKETCTELRPQVDEVVCAQTPEPFYSVGTWYANFLEVTDEEVRDFLEKSRESPEAEQEVFTE